MDGTKATTPLAEAAAQNGAGKNGRGERKRRGETSPANLRFFLPKSGTTSERPELGREMTSEGDALVESFRTGQVFFTLVSWKAVPDMEGDTPKIVKQALNRT